MLLDNKLSWEQHTISVVKKLTTARGIISKLRHFAPLSVLRNVYFSIVYSHLQYGISIWRHSAAKYINKIQVQQNHIVKIITKSSFIRTKLSPLYQKLSLLNLNNEKLFGGTEFQNRFKKRRKHLLNLGSLEKDCLRTSN